MPDIFSNKPKYVAKHSENYRILNALQLLQTLLIPGNNQSIDTAAEVEFLLKYRLNNSIDTPMEIKELIEVLNKIEKNIPEVANKPELKNAIDELIDKLEAAYQQNRPGLNK